MPRRFLDIDVILSEEERLPCVFKVNASHLGHLDTSSAQVATRRDLPRGTKIELPIWMSRQLSDKNMVDVHNPKHYGNRMRNEIVAGPNSVRFRDFSYYFFEAGIHLASLKKSQDDLEDKKDLVRNLRFGFSGERFANLLVRALSK